MTDCRLILDTAAEGGWNMAVDEVFLESANAGQTVLRFYGWAEATLSLGYFQSATDRQDHPGSRHCPLVRRTRAGGRSSTIMSSPTALPRRPRPLGRGTSSGSTRASTRP